MSMQKLWPNLALGVLVACAVLTTGLVARRELTSAPPRRANAAAPREVSAWRDYAGHGQRRGAPDAKVTITVFSDFQCPYCGMLARQLDTIFAEKPGDVAVVYRHYPLPNHPHAVPAARASECAGAQGRFWPFHDALFAGQDSIGTTPWLRYAEAARVPNLDRFSRCMAEGREPAMLARDAAAAERLEVAGTPTFLVNERLFRGAVPLPVLRREIEAALRR